MTQTITIWLYREAPEELQISTNGGDEDWLAEVPPGWYVPFIEDNRSFGCCSVEEHFHPTKEGWTIYIGCHA